MCRSLIIYIRFRLSSNIMNYGRRNFASHRFTSNVFMTYSIRDLGNSETFDRMFFFVTRRISIRELFSLNKMTNIHQFRWYHPACWITPHPRDTGCTFPYIPWIFLNSLRPRQNRRHFADDILKRSFLNENIWILIKILLKYVPKGPIDNIPSLFQIMAWRRPGDKPLSEPMIVTLPTHICVTRPQWVNDNKSCLVHLGANFIKHYMDTDEINNVWGIAS